MAGDGKDVYDLPVTSILYADGQKGIVSYWKPSIEELEMLNANGTLALAILGERMPPVSLHVLGAGEGEMFDLPAKA
jgi:hypothetical protein